MVRNTVIYCLCSAQDTEGRGEAKHKASDSLRPRGSHKALVRSLSRASELKEMARQRDEEPHPKSHSRRGTDAQVSLCLDVTSGLSRWWLVISTHGESG